MQFLATFSCDFLLTTNAIYGIWYIEDESGEFVDWVTQTAAVTTSQTALTVSTIAGFAVGGMVAIAWILCEICCAGCLEGFGFCRLDCGRHVYYLPYLGGCSTDVGCAMVLVGTGKPRIRITVSMYAVDECGADGGGEGFEDGSSVVSSSVAPPNRKPFAANMKKNKTATAMVVGVLLVDSFYFILFGKKPRTYSTVCRPVCFSCVDFGGGSCTMCHFVC